MKHPFDYAVSYSTAFLSAFDISGSLALNNFEQPLKDIHYDMDQLANDFKILEQDYLKAVEKLSKSEGITNEQSGN